MQLDSAAQIARKVVVEYREGVELAGGFRVNAAKDLLVQGKGVGDNLIRQIKVAFSERLPSSLKGLFGNGTLSMFRSACEINAGNT